MTRSSRRVKRAAGALGLAAGAAAAWSTTCSFVPPPIPLPGQALAADLGQLPLAQIGSWGPEDFNSPLEVLGPDPYFYVFVITSIIIVVWGSWGLTKQFWERRWVIEKVNAQKVMMITQEDDVTPMDQYKLAMLYVELGDYPSALAEFEEVEEDFTDVRQLFDDEDAMGALASRAQLHNSKGYSLLKLDPPRPAQARREFVRAVTFWPEYPEALLNIGIELIKRKRYDVAVRTLNTGLKWFPASEALQEAVNRARKGLDGMLDENNRYKLNP